MSNLRVLHVDLDTGGLVAKAGSSGGSGSGNYVNIGGDTMSGPLYLHEDPVADNQSSTKRYVDLQITAVRDDVALFASNVTTGLKAKVGIAGDTMTGHLVLNDDPVEPMHASTKQYTDNQIQNTAILKTGGTMIGPLQLSNTPTLDSHAATKGYVDDKVANLGVGDGYLPLSGGAMSGHISLVEHPTEEHHAVTKKYVDDSMQGMSFVDAARVATSYHVDLQDVTQIDDVVLEDGDRVLVKNQDDPTDNGTYVVELGTLTRTSDHFKPGTIVYVTEGSQHHDSGWILTTDGSIIIGSTPLSFHKFSSVESGSLDPDQYVAIAGDSMMGSLYLVGDPVDDNEAANKRYIDRTIKEIGYKYSQDEPSSVWLVEHNLDSINVLIQVFDHRNEMVIPSKIKIIDGNTVRIEFGSTRVTGSAQLIFL